MVSGTVHHAVARVLLYSCVVSIDIAWPGVHVHHPLVERHERLVSQHRLVPIIVVLDIQLCCVGAHHSGSRGNRRCWEDIAISEHQLACGCPAGETFLECIRPTHGVSSSEGGRRGVR